MKKYFSPLVLFFFFKSSFCQSDSIVVFSKMAIKESIDSTYFERMVSKRLIATPEDIELNKVIEKYIKEAAIGGIKCFDQSGKVILLEKIENIIQEKPKMMEIEGILWFKDWKDHCGFDLKWLSFYTQATDGQYEFVFKTQEEK